MALLQDRMGKLDTAEVHYRRALELDPQDPGAHNNYGVFLCKRKRHAEADSHFRQAVENPLYLTPGAAYENAGLCALGVPDKGKAMGYFRQALRANRNLPTSLLQLAQLHFADRQYEEAQAYLARHNKLAPPTPESLWLGARIERAMGNLDREADYVKRLRSDFPDAEETALWRATKGQ
jgi:type IV pilus assembly protein PilF